MSYWPRVRSRWLDIGQLLFFCVVIDRDRVEVHKHAKNEWDQTSHLDRTISAHKEFTIWKKYTTFLRDTAGNPERVRYPHFSRSGSPSQRRIRFVLRCNKANRPRSIYQYFYVAPRLAGQNCKFFKLLLFLNSQKRLGDKENNTKYRSLTWKPRSHVRILIYRTWPINYSFGSLLRSRSSQWLSRYPYKIINRLVNYKFRPASYQTTNQARTGVEPSSQLPW